MAYKEYFINTIQNTSIAAGSGATFAETDLRLDSDVNFEAIKFSHVATDSRILVRFKDDAFGRNYQNAALDLRTISGGPVSDIEFNSANQNPGFMPFVLPAPMLLRAATTFTLDMADNSGQANSLRLSMHGAKIRPGKAPWKEPWRATPVFFYTANVTIAANETASVNIPINIDSHFIVKKITGIRTGAALVTVKDGATDRQWQDRAVHIDNFMGNGHFPNMLPAPRFIYKGSVLNLTIQDLSGASNTIRIVLSGEKLFK